MPSIQKCCSNYLHGFHEIVEYRTNTAKENLIAIGKILSYALVFPVIIAATTYGICSLVGRCARGGVGPIISTREVAERVLSGKGRKITLDKFYADNEIRMGNEKIDIEKVLTDLDKELASRGFDMNQVARFALVAEFGGVYWSTAQPTEEDDTMSTERITRTGEGVKTITLREIAKIVIEDINDRIQVSPPNPSIAAHRRIRLGKQSDDPRNDYNRISDHRLRETDPAQGNWVYNILLSLQNTSHIYSFFDGYGRVYEIQA